MASNIAPIPGNVDARSAMRRRCAPPDSARRRSPSSSGSRSRNPRDKTVLGAYGRALAEAGNFNQAFEVLGRAHSPDQPDWHILSAQGAVLDQMGRHAEAQRYYVTALKIVPEEPSVLSNLGLSYALAKDLPNAETTLRRAAAQRPVDPRVRQNLALVVGLQGRFAEAEDIARADLPPDEAAANVAYLRQMLAHAAARRPQTTAPREDRRRPDASGRLRCAAIRRPKQTAAPIAAPSRGSRPDRE